MSLIPEHSKLRPLPTSFQAKVWRFASLGLIVGGLSLMGWGGWLFLQQEIEASQPPPAPIVNSLDLLPTDAPSPVPTPTIQQIDPTLTPAITPQSPNNLSTPPSSPTPEPTDTPLPTASSTPFPTPDPASLPLDLDPEGDVLSLADNPLLVSEESAVAETPPAEEAPALVENLPDNAVAENVAVAAPPAPVNRLVAENIGLDTSIVEVSWNTVMQEGIQVNVWTVADYAAGWHQNSNLPGQGGNIVLSGHHNIKGEVFRYIVDLEIGDTLTLYMGDQAFNYKVQDKFIVKDKGEPQEVRIANARWIGPFDDERLTLVTCWPYTDNTHRVIVIAKPVP